MSDELFPQRAPAGSDEHSVRPGTGPETVAAPPSAAITSALRLIARRHGDADTYPVDGEEAGSESAAPTTTARPRAGAEELLVGLNPNQRAAVVHPGGPLLVVAGAGSGKTRVLTHRIAYLIAGGVSPFEILAITFTNKAAGEMRHRVAELVGPVAQKMWVSTFHSACVRMLRRDAARLGFRSSFTIYDSDDAVRLTQMCIRDLDLDAKRFPPRTVHGVISQAKNEVILSAEYQARASNIYERKIGEVYAEYQRRLHTASAMDFDDLLLQTVTLLRSEPEVLEHYQRRFRHVLVDEYQDTNKAQNEIVLSIGAGYGNVTVVGDGDQSIYKFRGADLRNIVQFESAFPDTTVVVLDQNYRSTQNILDAANAVISQNLGRSPKRLWTDEGPGSAIVRFHAEDERDEAGFVAREAARLRSEEGYLWSDVAVFYRTNAQSRALEEAFVRSGIPYKVVGGTRFYDRKEIRDVMGYLRVVANPSDEVSLKRIINVPKRGVGDTSIARLEALARRSGRSFADVLDDPHGSDVAPKALGAIRLLLGLLDELRLIEGGPAPVIEAILDRTGYRAELEADGELEAMGRLENLAELVGQARGFTSVEEFLEAVSLVADADDTSPDDVAAGEVILMTIHTAKGLEFPAVFLIGLEDGVFPHVRSLGEPDELEEERRLAYVAITRARRVLHLSHAWARSLFGATQYNPVSRFVKEIPDELVRHVGLRPGSGTGPDASGWASRYGSGFGGGRDDLPNGKIFGGGRMSDAHRERIVEAAVNAGGNRPVKGTGAELLDLAAGDEVLHTRYGEGRIIEIIGTGDRAEVVIAFTGLGEKRFFLAMTPLKKKNGSGPS